VDWYLIVKTLHIIGSTVLFGTGMGIAFFMFRSHFTNDVHEKLFAARNTVLADYCFTLPAVVIQPVTGFWLVLQGGFEWFDIWLVATYMLYLLAGACWIPVVWIQIELKKMLQIAAADGTRLPARYDRLFKIWFMLGWPAFLSLIAVFYLMVTKPI